MLKKVGNIISGNFLLIMGVLALGLSCSWGPVFFSGTDQKAEGERIFRIFEGKEKEIRAQMEILANKISSGIDVKELWSGTIREDQEKHGLFYTVSANDTLIYWNSSLVAFDGINDQIRQEGRLKKLPTGWFYIFSQKVKNYTINGFMLIKRDFPYQNKYVQSAFQDDFHLSDQCEVVTEVDKGNIQVFCREGKFHFGIHYKQKTAGSSGQEIPALLFFLIFVVLVSAHFYRWISGLALKPLFKFALTVLFAGAFYLLLNFLKFPDEVYAGKLFAPFHFAWGKVLASLGDYLLLSFFLFYVSQSFFILLRKERNLSPFSSKNLLFHILASSYFAGSTGLFILLLNNSDLSLQLYRNFSLSLSNILASGCIALQIVGLGVILLRIRCFLKKKGSNFDFFLPSLLS
ncbi:MAG TPA: hypothetical protein VN249_11095, partial [Prolixibacteraceae bacterium]|nr:hypothetical protein [Prolixibacteraceae bacterium]